MHPTVEVFLIWINFIAIWYFIIVNLGYIILLVACIPDIFTRFLESEMGNIDQFTNSKLLPPICALVPAYNEEGAILNTIQSLLLSNYPNLQICVINDGSSDSTMELLTETYDLIEIFPVVPQKIKTASEYRVFSSQIFPNVTVIDKEHSGKSDSLNTGLNVSTTPLYLSIDADTLLEPNTISILAYSMLSQLHTIAEGGAIYVLNGCKYENGILEDAKMSIRPIVAMQTCEYIRAFIFGRTGWKQFQGPLVLSGALTLFERQAVLDVGGYRDVPGEDMEVIMALHEHMRRNRFPYRIGYSLSAAAWTHVPSNFVALWSQRDRWHRGLVDSLLKNMKMMFNPAYGATGLLSFPFQFFAEFLGPVVEFTGYLSVTLSLYFQIINWEFAVLFFIASLGVSTLLTLGSTLISLISFNKYQRKSDIILLLFLVIFENFGYRQLLTLCRFIALLRYPITLIHRPGKKDKKWG